MWRMKKTWVRDGELTIMMRCHTRLKYKEMGELGMEVRQRDHVVDGALETNM
jgi:hypothetical protein